MVFFFHLLFYTIIFVYNVHGGDDDDLQQILNKSKDLYWVDLTKEQIPLWYDSYEQELITGEESSDKDVKSIFKCNGPLKWRQHFYKGIIGYTNYSMNFVPKVWEQLWSKNVTLIFIGDSLIHQVESFFIRDTNKYYGYKNKRKQKNENSFYNIFVESMHSSTNKNLFKNVYNDSNHIAHHHTSVTRRENKNLSVSIWHIHLIAKNLDYNCTTNNYNQFSIEAINYINSVEKKNALIIPTFGAHFNFEKEINPTANLVGFKKKCKVQHPNMNQPFVTFIKSILTDYELLVSRKDVVNKILWLSPFPQHFSIPEANGYYHSLISDAVIIRDKCVEIQSNITNDWRYNVIQEQIANNSEYNSLYKDKILFYDNTHYFRYLHDMHVSNLDCTHYCYTPLLLQPIYRVLLEMLKKYPDY